MYQKSVAPEKRETRGRKRNNDDEFFSKKRSSAISPIRSTDPTKRRLPVTSKELPIEFLNENGTVYRTEVPYKTLYNLTQFLE